jgi:hypothetical protein
LPTSITNKFSLQFKGNIWKLCFDSQKEALLLEIRNGETQQASFAWLDIEKGIRIWEDFQLDEKWWVGLAEVYEGIGFFHQYADIRQPSPHEIIAIDLKTQQKIWHQPHHIFQSIVEGKVLATTFINRMPVHELLDIQTGKVWQNEVENSLKIKNKALINKNENGILFPFCYKEEDEHYATFQKFLLQKIELQIVKDVHYLEYKNLIILAYFLMKNSEFAQNLLILNNESEIMFHETLHQHLNGVGLDSFLVFKDQLYYIRQKNELICHHIKP